ncbi:MAG: hypothetical protein HPY54_14920 [Chthonomonadetes bacterium]|nr:hypothetical protein [Chthonomonadetes bacterium]
MREIIRQKIVDGIHAPIRPFVPRDVHLPQVSLPELITVRWAVDWFLGGD